MSDDAEKTNVRKRKRGPRRAKARARAIAAGMDIVDLDRPKEHRTHARDVKPAGLRDGQGLPLRIAGYEEFARNRAGGMPVAAAWHAAGYEEANGRAWELARDPDFIARVAEIRAGYVDGLQVRFLQEQLLAIATADIANYYDQGRDGLGVKITGIAEDGFPVIAVMPDGLFARAGLRDGDIAVSLGGLPLLERLQSGPLPTGIPLTVVYRREGEELHAPSLSRPSRSPNRDRNRS